MIYLYCLADYMLIHSRE